ncbi:MAG: flavin-containing monooxygenase [Acidimicrobiales bacterium]
MTTTASFGGLPPGLDDDDTVRRALEVAEIPALMPAIAYLTGDMSLLRDELRPDPARMLEPEAGLTPEAMALGRRLAFEGLTRFRDNGAVPAAQPSEEDLRAMLKFLAAGSAGDVDDYALLLEEELGLEDLRAPDWTRDDLAPERPFSVAVIGAGMSGLLAAHRLEQAGIDFVVLEQATEVGGTWLKNQYPGCRVDVSNLFYSYSFEQRTDWPQLFSSQPELLGYFRHFADRAGLRDHIRFSTEVRSATWDDQRLEWRLRLHPLSDLDQDETPDQPESDEEELVVQAIVSAVGQLNRPQLPKIAGIEHFAGPSFHSAEWDSDVELAGKRVAVIGTGASAMQIVPSIAGRVEHLDVYQRTPAWLIPTPDYTADVSAEQHWLFENVPAYANWSRLWTFWRNVEGLLPAGRVDPSWDRDTNNSVGEINELARLVMQAYLETEFSDSPDLLARVIPDYPVAAKRMIRDDGSWAAALSRDNVELVTDPIAEITEHGVRTADGCEREADVIVYGTGFSASEFLTPMRVTGRNGADLHEQWAGSASAYLGITVPNFPNLFCLYGPNTNIVINGSIIYFSECEVFYLQQCIRALLASGHAALDCRPEVLDRYQAWVDEGNRSMAWGVSSVNTWYKNADGRITQNWPFSLLEYWKQTREVHLDDFELL